MISMDKTNPYDDIVDDPMGDSEITPRLRWVTPSGLAGAPRRLQQMISPGPGLEPMWVTIPVIVDEEAFIG